MLRSMKWYYLTCGMVLFSAAATALAVDRIRTTDGKSINGTIESMARTEIVLNTTGGNQQKIEVNRIDSIELTDEPPQLTLIRSAIKAGNYEQAVKNLDVIDPQKIARLEIKQEVEFFAARAKVGLALTSGQMKDLRDAGQAITRYRDANPTTWRYYEICQLIGDLFVAMGETQQAVEAYKQLEVAPWEDYKMRGAISRGRAHQQANQFEDALKAYEEALGRAAGKEDPQISAQTLSATVGKAACLAETGKAEEGLAMMHQVIENANPEDKELHAVAFVTAGNCYLKAGKPKEALLEFLKVDLLYNAYPQYHAEALYHLGNLWKLVGKADRADEARDILATRYSNSRWARMAPQ